MRTPVACSLNEREMLRVLNALRKLANRFGQQAGIVGHFNSLGDFGLTWVIGGNVRGQTHTAAIEIYDALQARREGDALALSLVLTGIAVALLYGVNKLTTKARGR